MNDIFLISALALPQSTVASI